MKISLSLFLVVLSFSATVTAKEDENVFLSNSVSVAKKAVDVIGKNNVVHDAVEIVSDCDDGSKECIKSVAGTAAAVGVEVMAVPAAVAIASASGVTASTGTAIAALGGAAATNATLAAIGTPIVSGLAGIGVTLGAPVVVGGFIVLTAATGAAIAAKKGVDYVVGRFSKKKRANNAATPVVVKKEEPQFPGYKQYQPN